MPTILTSSPAVPLNHKFLHKSNCASHRNPPTDDSEYNLIDLPNPCPSVTAIQFVPVTLTSSRRRRRPLLEFRDALSACMSYNSRWSTDPSPAAAAAAAILSKWACPSIDKKNGESESWLAGVDARSPN